MWIAATTLTVRKDDGTYETRTIGDPVPEVTHWPNRSAYIGTRQILEVPHVHLEELGPDIRVRLGYLGCVDKLLRNGVLKPASTAVVPAPVAASEPPAPVSEPSSTGASAAEAAPLGADDTKPSLEPAVMAAEERKRAVATSDGPGTARPRRR